MYGISVFNPNAEIVAQLRALESHEALAGNLIGMAEFMNAVDAHMSEELGSMNIKLPLMSSLESVQKRQMVSTGSIPGYGMPDLMASAFQSVRTLPTLLGTFYSELKIMLDAALPVDPLQPIPPVVDTAKALVVSYQNQFNGLVSSESSAYNSGVSALKDYAYNAFLASSHSPAVKELLSSFTVIPESANDDQRFASVAGSVASSILHPENNIYSLTGADTAVPPPSTATAQPADGPKYQTMVNAQTLNVAAEKDMAEAYAACEAWQEARGMRELINQVKADPDNEELKAQLEALTVEYKAQVYDTYELARSNFIETRQALLESVANLNT